MNNLPQKSNGLFNKIKRYLFRLFSNKDLNIIDQSKEIINEKVVLDDNKLNFVDDLQKDLKKQNLEDSIINDIEKNPELIYSLSIEKINMLTKIYNERTEKINKEIERLLTSSKQTS